MVVTPIYNPTCNICVLSFLHLLIKFFHFCLFEDSYPDTCEVTPHPLHFTKN